jgi:hypothetical protein
MKKNNHTRELEWASSYLDQALNADELADFAQQLSQNPEISQTISDFAQIRQLVRSIPQEKPPRSYILTRQMASEARKPGILERFFPAFRTAAILCALGLIFTFILPFAQTHQPASLPAEYSKKSIDPLLLEQSSDLEFTKQAEITTAVSGSEKEPQPVSETQADPLEVRKPSHGFKGGSPKNELLMVSTRILPDDHQEEQSTVIADLAAENQAKKKSENTANPVIPSFLTNDVNFLDAILQIIRFVFIIVLGLSFIWILLTLYERKRTF